MKFLILFSCLLLSPNLQVEAYWNPVIQKCSNSANYKSNSQFQTNLSLLLQTLRSNGTREGYFITSTGVGSDTVYGLVQCAADKPMEKCVTCLNASTVAITERCPGAKEATLRYNECALRYSNRRFFAEVDNYPTATTNPANVSDDRFNQQLAVLMNNLSSTAASRPNRYESGSADYGSSNKIYAKVQCDRDLSATGCQSCAKSMISSIPECCDKAKGARIYSSTCIVRYESDPFVADDSIYVNSPVYIPFPVTISQPVSRPPVTNSQPGTANNNDQHVDGNGKGKSINVVVIVAPIVASVLLLAIFALLYIRKRTRKSGRKTKPEIQMPFVIEDETDDSLQIDLDTIRTATNDFSEANKLGEGGFGAVYKGELLDGQVIAVKRLSNRNSGQGSQEFKNEVILLLKLQHRNLVRLLGFCLGEEEKLLIYEFVPNTSLDKYIFDPIKRSLLDWKRRYKIIGGVARGLVYLHEDSRLRIVHRDLKSGNILLDEEMNAKIADFGVAKLFGVDQTHGNTRKIAGTYGYMAPEYALHGLFSPKSDVYSFGVLVLEIISGQKTNNFHRSGRSRDLLSYTWKLWTDGNALQLMDPTLMDNYSADEVMRCVHIGLLCIQDNSDRRPTMSSIITMLNSYSVALETPSAPALLLDTRTGGDDDASDAEFNSSNCL